MTWRRPDLMRGLAWRATNVLALVAALSARVWGQAAPSGSHAAAKPTDTGFASQVNATGGFSAAIPLDIPPAKRGLPVPVSVVYGGRAVGAAGMGWDIPLSYIVRDTSYAHRLPWYDETVPDSARGTTVPRGVEQLILVMGGQPTRLMRKGDQQASTTWVPVQDGPQLEVHEDAAHGTMLVYDGDGRTYTFVNTGPVGLPGERPAGHLPLLDGKLYTLASITAPGNKVRIEYLNTLYPLSDGSIGLEVDLHSISYNSPTSTSNCYKNRIVLTYNQPKVVQRKFVPLSMTMIGNGFLVRMSTIKWIDVHAFDRCNGATDLILRRYLFDYDDDPDTGVLRLTSVGMSGRHGSAEVNKVISLGQFGYGVASVGNGPSGRVLRYDLKQTVLLPTEGRALGESTSRVTDRGTWSQLVDVTGDGRPDLVHQVAGRNTFEIAANSPSPGGGTSFNVTNAVPPSVLGAPDKPLEREWISNTPSDLDITMSGRRGRDQDVWRQLIDVNGDGRVDVVDAREVAGEWVVYLNTPGPTSWQVRWRRTRIDMTKLRQVLRDHGHVIDDFLPLSRRHTGMEGVMTAIFTCRASTCAPGSDGWVLSANGIPSPTVVVQSTYVEWEVRDVNGDGYVDMVFNDVGGVNETETPTRPNVEGVPGTEAEGRLTHTVELPATGIDVVYNLAGPLLNGGENGVSLYPFSAPVQVRSATPMVSVGDRSTDLPCRPEDMPCYWSTRSPVRRCGVGLWVQGQPTGLITPDSRPIFIDLSTQYCGFSDVNGDGLVDRIEGTTAYLQGGNANFGVTTLTLPSYAQGSSNDSRVLCCNDRNSTCRDDIVRAINFNAYQEFALRDINGDGIPDHIDQRIDRQTLEFAEVVHLGTGVGFGPELTLQTGNPLRPMTMSYETLGCPGFFELADAHTTIGIYDLDGDGKVEMVDSAGNVYALNDGSQADWGRPGAGRLISVDNGHGALTRITYRSAKEDIIWPHQVPFAEIVATRVETVKSSGGAPLAAEVDYAFGLPEMIFDSLLKQWQFSGYRRMITMQRDGSGTGRMMVTDTHTLQPISAGQGESDRFLAHGKLGRPRDVTVLAGAMSDPWAELGVAVGDVPDPRVIGATHYDYAMRMFTEPTDPTVAFCRELVDPYDYVSSQQNTSSWPVCVTHGFTFAGATTAWRGTAAPPSTANVNTFTVVLRDTYGRVTDHISIADGDIPLAVELSYATPTTAVGSNAPRILNAVTNRRVRNILSVTEAEESWQYDGDNPDSPNGTVSSGLPTTHTVMRIRNDGLFGGPLGKVRMTFAWDSTASALTSVSTAREDSAGHPDGASQTVSLDDYDEFQLIPKLIEVTAVSAAGAPPIPSLITTLQPDDFSLAVQSAIDENGTQQISCRDGFDRVYETFAGPSTGSQKVTSTTSYGGFANGEAGPRRITTKTFVDLNAPAELCRSPVPPPTTPGVSSTVTLDELGRASYTATQLGADYGNQTLITDAQIYDLWGRTVYTADHAFRCYSWRTSTPAVHV